MQLPDCPPSAQVCRVVGEAVVGCAGRYVPLSSLSSISGDLRANQNSVNHSSPWKMPTLLCFQLTGVLLASSS